MATDFAQEPGAGLDAAELPSYAPMLAAFHRACAAPLRALVDLVPLSAGAIVLDMACGDGVYAPMLAERVGPTGRVVAVDRSAAFLQVAASHAAATAYAERISFKTGDIRRLPFDAGTFDGVWCAHSLYSLPDPLAALREMCRVTKPGGLVAVLENDTLHHHLLPWPADLELALRQAQLEDLQQSASQADKFYIGRQLREVFALAGLEDCALSAHSIDHCAPLSADERTFLGEYLADLASRARSHLDSAAQRAIDLLINPASELFLLNQPSFFSSHLELLAWGRRPAVAAEKPAAGYAMRCRG